MTVVAHDEQNGNTIPKFMEPKSKDDMRLKQPQSHRDLDFRQKLFHLEGKEGVSVIIVVVKVKKLYEDGIGDENDYGRKLKNLYYRVEDALERAREILTDDGLPF